MVSPARRLAGSVLRRLAGPEVLRLEFRTPEQFASFLDDPRARKGFSRLDLRVSPWYAARPGWTGRLGPLPGVASLDTSFDEAGLSARVRLSLSEPIEAARLVRAAYPLFFPTRPEAGFGGKRVGVHPGAPADQRWNTGGGVRALLPKKLKTTRFTEYEVLVDAAGEHWLGDLDGSLSLIERPAVPDVLIDPKVHRPLERRQPRHDTLSATATVAGERFLVAAAGRVLLDVPQAAPLTATDLRSLALVTDIDLRALPAAASARVAELAAYGAVLHDAPMALSLAPDLLGLLAQPLPELQLLDWANRSLAQVRSVMASHTRAATLPQPSVSVLLSTVRPDLLGVILDQLAAQDHPEVELVVGCHGFEAPDRQAFSRRVRDRLGPMLSFDSSVLFGDVLAALSEAASGDLLSKVDDDDLYGPHHLGDLVTAWRYSDAQLVGRKLALVHFAEEDTLYVRRFFLEGYRWDAAGGASIIARGDLAGIGGWRSQRRAVDHGLMTRIADAGGSVYTCSGPGYVHVRHTDSHTYAVDDSRFKQKFFDHTVPGVPPAALGILESGPQVVG